MTNNNFILKMDINLEEKLHEQEIYKNILERTTIDYLAMREKIAYIHSLVKEYETKNNDLLGHLTKYKNQEDEALYQKAELEKAIISKAAKRKQHIKFLESQVALIKSKKNKQDVSKQAEQVKFIKRNKDLVEINNKIDNLTVKYQLLCKIQENEQETQEILLQQQKEIEYVFGTKEQRDIGSQKSQHKMHGYQLHRFFNQDIDKKRKLKQKYLTDLENARKVHIQDVKEARAVNKNKSFEVIDFTQPNIRNVLIITQK